MTNATGRALALAWIALLGIIACSAPISSAQYYDDYGEDDDDGVEQVVLFCLGGLTAQHSTASYMPRLHSVLRRYGGVYASKSRTLYAPNSHQMGWVALFSSADVEEYGCTAGDEYCPSAAHGGDGLPASVARYRSALDVLADDQYAVHVFSDRPAEQFAAHLGSARRYPASRSHDALSTFDAACNEHNLTPRTRKRVVVVHTDVLVDVARARGYGSENYRAQLLCVDAMIERAILRLWAARPESSAFFLLSNHGGHGYDHNALCLDSVQVPLLGLGKHVRRHAVLFAEPVEALQFAPTLVSVALGPERLYLQGESDDEEGASPSPLPEYWKHRTADECLSEYAHCLKRHRWMAHANRSALYDLCEPEDDGASLHDYQPRQGEGPHSPLVLYGHERHGLGSDFQYCSSGADYRHDAQTGSLALLFVSLVLLAALAGASAWFDRVDVL